MSEKYYFITSVRRVKNSFPEGTKNYKNEDVGGMEYYTTDTRCWGFYRSKDKAIKAVKENWTDMNECGYYHWVVIEEMEEGLIYYPRKEIWFEENFDINVVKKAMKGKSEDEINSLNFRRNDNGHITWIEQIENRKIVHSNFKGYKRTKKPEWAEHTCGWGIG